MPRTPTKLRRNSLKMPQTSIPASEFVKILINSIDFAVHYNFSPNQAPRDTSEPSPRPERISRFESIKGDSAVFPMGHNTLIILAATL